MAQTIGGCKVAMTPASRDFVRVWSKFNPSKQVFPAGWKRELTYRALPVAIIWEQDVPIKMRDGVILHGDTFRPEFMEGRPVPAVLSYSPYGKTDKGFQNAILNDVGVPRERLSGLESFEGLDPAEWCARGYAICNVDARGSYESEGDIYVHGAQEGRDGYDTIEWIAEQPWSNGAVGLAGNSWLAVCQWYIAAEKPPHLKAMAPWEGATDFYRQLLARGGVVNVPFIKYIMGSLTGHNNREDTLAMVKKYPLFNEYWEDKRVKFERLEIPMSILGSYSTFLHTEGAVSAFLYSASPNKWFRIHPTQEWHDLYSAAATDDLNSFFDRYLVGKDNGWEATPKVRLSLLRFNGPPITSRPELEYPPARVRYKQLFLDAKTGTLNFDGAPQSESTTAYDSTSWVDESHFTYKFSEYTELIGYSKATLYMSCEDTDDMDVYVLVRKLDRDGVPLLNYNIPMKDYPPGRKKEDIPDRNLYKYIGPNGSLRASMRDRLDTDPTVSPDKQHLISPAQIYRPYNKIEKLKHGEKVRMEIQLWPGGIVFEEGESLRLEVKGHMITFPENNDMSKKGKPTNLNQGMHRIYTGGTSPNPISVTDLVGGNTILTPLKKNLQIGVAKRSLMIASRLHCGTDSSCALDLQDVLKLDGQDWIQLQF